MNPVTKGNMRFTVISPMCVRMEFSPEGCFRDLPTLFAENRELRSKDFKVWEEADQFYLKTSCLTLHYYWQEKRPQSGTLQIDHAGGSWTYGTLNFGDLGGVLQSLDNCDRAWPLPQGFLSRDGWQVIDDSSASVLKDGWIVADPREEGYFDLYFFYYGHDY